MSNVCLLAIAWERKTTLMLSLCVKYGVASFSSCSKSICNEETGTTRIRRGLMNDGAVFRAWTPLASVHKTIDNWHLPPPPPLPQKGQAPRLPPNWFETFANMTPPLWRGASYVVGCNGKEVLGRSPIWTFFSALGGLTSEFPWDQG